MQVEEKVVYFSEPGEANTDATLRLAREYADRHGIRHVVVASTTGKTGLKAVEVFKGLNLVVVTHSTGFVKPNFQEMPEDVRREIEAKGAKVLTCTHALAGVERAFRREFGLWLPVELVAIVLRRVFCEGVKVAIEITMMAVDAGLIPEGEDVVAVAGTGRGADTALHIKSASTSNFLKLKVRRVICKPDTF
ncbi:MAG: hypothetical protein DRJ56_04325 [Thermoprotei archaeon]|nr:MAG: hypothetical protein DRJ56_04325 [Thermoprotei archaeon]